MSDTSHSSASRTARELSSWQPSNGSADSDLLPGLGTIVARSRDLARNHGVASSAIQTLTDNVVGDGYPSQTVNFGRDASFTKALTGSNTWATASVNPLDSLETWAGDVQSKSGVVAKTVVMDPEAWKIFRNNPFVEKYLVDLRRGTNNSLNIDPMVRGRDSKARYVGSCSCNCNNPLIKSSESN